VSDDLVTWLRAEILADKAAAEIISDGGFAPERWDSEPPGEVNLPRLPQADAITAALGINPHDEAFPRHEHWTELVSWERENDEPESARVRESDLPVAIVNDGRREADHIRRHDPRFAVADCEAKLAILDEHTHAPADLDSEGSADFGCRTCHMVHDEFTAAAGWCKTVRLLASGYQHRPGYQEEWKP